MNPFQSVEVIPEGGIPKATGTATLYQNATGERVIGSALRLQNQDWRLVGEIPLTRVLATFSTYNNRLVVATATTADGRSAGSLLLLDLDHFKRINDQRGHPAGDRVLQGFAQVIRSTLRENDLPARIGGEEFAVLAPQTSPQDAEELAHRIRRETKEQLGVTVSIGIAGVDAAGPHPRDGDLAAVFAAADSALYTSKRGGRNRVTVYAPNNGS